jgi:hypothetical protein
MSYLQEDIRTLVADRIADTATTPATFYRAPSMAQDANWPAFILEYGDNDNELAGTSSDRKTFIFNLYVAYKYDPADESSRDLAEKAISDAIGELYRVTFEKPDCLNLASGWLRAGTVSWGFATGQGEIPLRMAEMQIAVTVIQDRS